MEAKRLGASRNTVKQYLLSGVVVPRYKPRPKRAPVIGARTDRPQEWLAFDEQRPRKERRTAQRMFELLLADELRRRSARPTEVLHGLFQRMAFNALISNTDDHPRNHALLAPTEKWELSPAYDLTPNPLASQDKRDLAMTCGRFNRYANRANLLSEHPQFKLSPEQARAIVDQVQLVVAARWLPVLRQHGATAAECERLAPAFNDPGFELNPARVIAAQG